ncbi:MAG: hypothetical protein ACI4WM_04110, partial [Erysipelotrichaceae bacterium]
MKNEVYLNEYRDYRKGLKEPNNRCLYIDSVVKHYGSDFAKAFNTEVYVLIISMDSFFAHISSKDAAEILKKAEELTTPAIKTTALLRKAFASDAKYVFADSRKVTPVYKDESLRGLYGWKKKFR